MRDIDQTVATLMLCLALLCWSGTTTGETITLTAGIIDGFAEPVELASPSDELVTGLVPFGGVQDFDQTVGLNGGAANTQVAHTFTGLPDQIISATLQLTVRAGDEEFVNTDGLLLSFYKDSGVDYAESTAWRRTFGPITEDVNLFPAPDDGLFDSWSPNDQRMLELNLGALPLAGGGSVNLIPDLNDENFLDVIVSDETAVDFMSLVLSIPEPSTVGLLLMALVTIVVPRCESGSP